jgi:hypothetical protein
MEDYLKLDWLFEKKIELYFGYFIFPEVLEEILLFGRLALWITLYLSLIKMLLVELNKPLIFSFTY